MDSGKKENQGSLYYQKKNLVFVPVVDSSLRDYSLFVLAMQQPNICLELFGNHVYTIRGGNLPLEEKEWEIIHMLEIAILGLTKRIEVLENHVNWGGSLRRKDNPENWDRPALERDLDAGAFQQLGRERGQIGVTGGNPVPPQLSPIEPNQQDRGSNQRGYAERVREDLLGSNTMIGCNPETPAISQLLAGIFTGENRKLVYRHIG